MLDIFSSFERSALVRKPLKSDGWAYNVITVRTRLIRIGNSRGIRIPKPLLEQVGLRDTVQIRAEKGRLVVQPEKELRQGWEEAFRRMADSGDDRLIPDSPANAFDTKKWKW
jgi:antitoxin MazE